MSILNILHIKTFFEMSRDDHPRHSSKHVHFKYLAYFNFKMSGDPQSNSQLSQVGSKDLKQEVLIQLQALYYRGSSNGSKKWTRCFEAFSHNLRQGQKNNRKKKEVTCASQFRLHYTMMHQIMTSPCNVFAMQNV
jgi:hypothetical protein